MKQSIPTYPLLRNRPLPVDIQYVPVDGLESHFDHIGKLLLNELLLPVRKSSCGHHRRHDVVAHHAASERGRLVRVFDQRGRRRSDDGIQVLLHDLDELRSLLFEELHRKKCSPVLRNEREHFIHEPRVQIDVLPFSFPS